MTDTETLRRTMEETLQTCRMKGMVVGVARGNGLPEVTVLGTDAAGRPLSEDSLFPVASVTKLATALALLRVAGTGVAYLDDPLARHLPDAFAAQPGVTLRRLLSHTSGLPLDVSPTEAPYAQGLDWPALARACLQTPLERAPGTRVQYSNVGYGLLALIVEQKTGLGFPEALEALVLRPLGIEGYLGTQPPRPSVVLGGLRGPHAKTDLEPYNSPFWQSLALPWGGLMTTVHGVLALVRCFQGYPEGLLQLELLEEATRNQTDDLAGGFLKPLVWKSCPWGLGPELRDAKRPHWTPPQASPRSFGHSGMSGCLAWADPDAGIAWVFMGTRIADSGWLIRRGPALGAAILQG